MKIASIFGISLLALAPACSNHSSHQPIIVTFLDVEWDAPDKLTGLAQDLQELHEKQAYELSGFRAPKALSINLPCGVSCWRWAPPLPMSAALT